MNLLLPLISTTIALSMAKLFGTTSRHTIKTYIDPSPVLISTEQNPYLSLPQRSSYTVEGSRLIYVDVPPPINTYVWELTGFYEARTTGEHIFSIEGTEMATIQLGWKRKHALSFEKLIVDTFKVLDGNPQRYKFKKGELYPVKIMYIAGPDNGIKIFVSENDTNLNLNTRIKPHSPHIPGNTNSNTTGFAFSLYTYLGSESRDSMIKKYSTSELLSEGWISEELSQPKVLMQPASHVLEILGYFRVPADGKYSVEIAPWSSSVLQIGTGIGQMGPRYLVDYEWKILDTRPSMTTLNSTFSDFHFQMSSLYPFRIVVLANTTDPEWDLTVRYHNGTEIDIFNLWDGNGSDTVDGLINVERFSENPLSFDGFNNDFGPLRGDMSPETFDPTAFIMHPNNHEVTDWILGEDDAVAFYASRNLKSANESRRGETSQVAEPVLEVTEALEGDSFSVSPDSRNIVDVSFRVSLTNPTTIDMKEPQPIDANLTGSLKPCKYVSPTLPETQLSTNISTDSVNSRASISFNSDSIATIEMFANRKSFSNGIFGVKGSNPYYPNATEIGLPKALEQEETSFHYHSWNNSQHSFIKSSVSSSIREIMKFLFNEKSKGFDHIGSSPGPYTSVRKRPNPYSTEPESLVRTPTAEEKTVSKTTFPKISYQRLLKEQEYCEKLDSSTRLENLEDIETEIASCEKNHPFLLSQEDIASLTISKNISLRWILVLLLIALIFI